MVRAAPVAARIPGLFPAMYVLMGRSVRFRQRVGTVAVTAIGMFAGGGGYALAPPTLMSLQVVVGGIERVWPRVVDRQLEIRDVLDLTVTIDHNVVDGAPAACFGAELRELIEDAYRSARSGATTPSPVEENDRAPPLRSLARKDWV